MGRKDVLDTLIRSVSDHSHLKRMEGFSLLLWHVLMACPAKQESHPAVRTGFNTTGMSASRVQIPLQKSTRSEYEGCIELLMKASFPVYSPRHFQKDATPSQGDNSTSSTPYYYCSDVAALKQLNVSTS